MTEHHELVQEMATIERMATQDRLKHARKRRLQQLKRWSHYDKHFEKESGKKKKKNDSMRQETSSTKRPRRPKSERLRFVPNISLLESAARNDLEEVRRLLEEKVSPDVTNEDGLTALHQCCIDDNEEMLKLLLEFGANVNACDSEMWTPLHASATCGHVTLCKHLIDKGAELLAVNADGNMPYDICEDEITLDYIETEMAKRGITQEQIDDTRLMTERQMLSDLKGLASSGGDLEFQEANGATMLHIASANGYHEVVDFLLDHHVSVDSRDAESWQPIHAAAYWGQLEILEMLVQNGADLDSKTKNGETAFDLCEDPDIKQKILDMKDEIETNKASRQRPGSARKPKHSTSRNTSMRRSSIRGEKSNLFKKEAHEEALHFGLRMLQDDEDELAEVDEDRELPATNIDDVTISIEDHDPENNKTVNGESQEQQQLPQPLQPPSDSRSDPLKVSRTESNNVPHTNNSPRPLPAPRNTEKTSTYTAGSPAQGRTGQDDKKQVLEDHFQSMFLEGLPNNNRRSTTGGSVTRRQFYPPPMTEKKNGHNNNNNGTPANATTTTTTTPTATLNNNHTTNPQQQVMYRDGQLRRFVAPPSAPVVGGDDEDKQRCCVIL